VKRRRGHGTVPPVTHTCTSAFPGTTLERGKRGLQQALDVHFIHTLPVLVTSRHSRGSGNPGVRALGTGCLRAQA